jgi:hypothetical protein
MWVIVWVAAETMKRVNQHLDEELNVLSLIEG